MITSIDENTFGREFLEEIVQWVGSNLEPEAVFEEDALRDWAGHQAPGNIFSDSDLSDWAEASGYVHESEIER